MTVVCDSSESLLLVECVAAMGLGFELPDFAAVHRLVPIIIN